ncbi:ChaN family lipoprotein [Ramlibacter rhizophilus]|uniref:ChaN family lipoprotein n=1 Tax=Ramlibacter rhizophilus TaxID=1781167 RepID=UPI001F0F7068|nr:ChaN family lipoprotein [Ramlibacter rhizophilus]
MRLLSFLLACATLAAGCAAAPPAAGDKDVDLLLLGEQHDAAEHQRLHHQTVVDLLGRGRLAALVLEMAEEGATTAGLPRNADESAVRSALGWSEQAWHWQAYAPAVMAAVRAGVPVLGANLPRQQMRGAMADARLDAALPPEAMARHREAIRAGHCDLIPAERLGPMARIQVARDQAMARTLAQAARRGATVVLLAGSGHVDPELGVPRHLREDLSVRPVTWPPQPPKKDYCAELRRQMGR